MEYLLLLLPFFLLILLLLTIRRTVVFEHQSGLLYRDGKFVRLLKPGRHWLMVPWYSIHKIDMREFTVTIPGQEVLTADNLGLKISLAAAYRVADPFAAVNTVVNYQEALYQLIQVAARDVIGSLEVDVLLAKRSEIGRTLFEKTSEKASALGIELKSIELKDVMFPGELKNIFAQVVHARKEGLAALERARGESASLRNLANAARLFENNPDLRQLRLLQMLEKTGNNTIVLVSPDGMPSLNPQKR